VNGALHAGAIHEPAGERPNLVEADLAGFQAPRQVEGEADDGI
jgi:hypothetical protein